MPPSISVLEHASRLYVFETWLLITEISLCGYRSPAEVNERCDRLIKDIRERFHAPALNRAKGDPDADCADVLIVAHGHILRAFAQRWTGLSLHEGPSFLLEAGGVGTLR